MIQFFYSANNRGAVFGYKTRFIKLVIKKKENAIKNKHIFYDKTCIKKHPVWDFNQIKIKFWFHPKAEITDIEKEDRRERAFLDSRQFIATLTFIKKLNLIRHAFGLVPHMPSCFLEEIKNNNNKKWSV